MLPVTYYIRQTKEKITDVIDKALKAAYEKDATKLVIYYCGHGFATNGDWVCYPDKTSVSVEDYFNVEDLLNLVDSSNYDRSIEITSESCFSGKMCKKAKEWIESRRNNKCKKGHDLKHYTTHPNAEPVCRTCKKAINVEHIDGIYRCD
jgi:hypothetical protein